MSIFRRKTPEQIWDESSMYTTYPSWTAQVANWFGFKGLEEKARDEAADERWWNERAERCPNNPHNGAEYEPPTLLGGLQIKEDRRGPEWQTLEEYREQQVREREVDPLTVDNVDTVRGQSNEQFWDSVQRRSEIELEHDEPTLLEDPEPQQQGRWYDRFLPQRSQPEPELDAADQEIVEAELVPDTEPTLTADDWPESAIRGLGNMRDRGEITDPEHEAAVAYVRDEYGLDEQCSEGPQEVSGAAPVEVLEAEVVDEPEVKVPWYQQLEYDLNRDIRHPDITERMQYWDRELFGDGPAPVETLEPEVVEEAALVTAAREWIADCSWDDLDPEHVAELTADEVLAGVERTYDGGLDAFTRDTEPAQAPVLEAELVETETEAVFEAEGINGLDTVCTDTGQGRVCPRCSGAHLGLETELAASVAELTEDELAAAPAEDLEPEADGPGSGSDDQGDTAPVPTEQQIAEPEASFAEPEASFAEPDVAEPEVTTPSAREIEPPPPSNEKDALTEHIIKELRSGDHKQVCGAWQDRGILFGADKECLWQMTMNTTGMNMDEIRSVYHDETTVGDGFNMNDSQRKSFPEIADHFENNVLSPKRKRELDEYELGQ